MINSVVEIALVFEEEYTVSVDSLADDLVLWNHDRELWQEQKPRWLEMALMAGEDWGMVLKMNMLWALQKMTFTG